MKRRNRQRLLAESAEELHDEDGAMDTNGIGKEEDESDRFHFFWKDGSPLSQWHRSVYELNGVTYTCAEQGMMHGRALLFGDEETASQILRAESPRKMKALGRRVRGFKDSTWKKHRERIVYQHNIAKFGQNLRMHQALMNTNGLLVEASPSDCIWGIGLAEDVARTTQPDQWPGTNLLGQILTRVREELRAQSRDIMS